MSFFSAFSHLDWNQVSHLTLQHITLVGIAVTLAILVGVPLGVVMTRFPTLACPLPAPATLPPPVPPTGDQGRNATPRLPQNVSSGSAVWLNLGENSF